MEHAEYVHTTGMDEADVEAHLHESEHGVLALADADDAYAVPISHHYDDERLLLRVSHHGDDAAEKVRYLETTRTATFVCHEANDSSSWSVLVRGPIAPWTGDVSESTLNEWFPPFRLFDESVDEVEFTLYELEMRSVVGRRTV